MSVNMSVGSDKIAQYRGVAHYAVRYGAVAAQALVCHDRALGENFCNDKLNRVCVGVGDALFLVDSLLVSTRAPKLWKALQKQCLQRKDHYNIPQEKYGPFSAPARVWMRLLLYTYSQHYMLPAAPPHVRATFHNWNHPGDDLIMYNMAVTFQLPHLMHQSFEMLRAWFDIPAHHERACRDFHNLIQTFYIYSNDAAGPPTGPAQEYLVRFYYSHTEYVHSLCDIQSLMDKLERAGAMHHFEDKEQLRDNLPPCGDCDQDALDAFKRRRRLIDSDVNMTAAEDITDAEVEGMKGRLDNVARTDGVMVDRSTLDRQSGAVQMFILLPPRVRRAVLASLEPSVFKGMLLQVEMEDAAREPIVID